MPKKYSLRGVLPVLLGLALLVLADLSKEHARPAAAVYPPGEITWLGPSPGGSPTVTATFSSTRTAHAMRANPARTPTPTPPAGPLPSPGEWKDWPVMPAVSAEMRQVYRGGLANGTDARAFSILGDCQSLPEVFLGPYDSNPEAYNALPPNLKETVTWFAGSFDRYSPTVKDASTAGAMLWSEWNDNAWGECTPGETPIDCELRVHRPSIVLIHVGTHWEARNRRYLEILIQKILATGAVPLLATKADNRELDERVNQSVAELAYERGLPLWNFWGALKETPNHGLVGNSNMYLTEEALEVHRRSALEALDTVWRALNEEPASP